MKVMGRGSGGPFEYSSWKEKKRDAVYLYVWERELLSDLMN